DYYPPFINLPGHPGNIQPHTYSNTHTLIHTHFNSLQSTEQCNITRTTHGCAQILKTYITIFRLHVWFLSHYIDKCMSATFNILSLTHTHTLSHLSLFLSLFTTHSHTHTLTHTLLHLHTHSLTLTLTHTHTHTHTLTHTHSYT